MIKQTHESVLSGLTVDCCQACNTETVSIPRMTDLHRKLAGTTLSKPRALTGREFRFLRTVGGLSIGAFAQEPGVIPQTIQAWERLRALRFVNDVPVRMLIASLLGLGEERCRSRLSIGGVTDD